MNATKVVNLKSRPHPQPPFVYIGRRNRQYPKGSLWGNPYKLGEYTLEEALTKYAIYFDGLVKSDAKFREETIKLYGKTLACYCKPAPCHGDIIVEWVERYMREMNEAVQDSPKLKTETGSPDPEVNDPRADAAEQGLSIMVQIGRVKKPEKEEVLSVEPGESFRLTADGEPDDSFIHVMGLRGKLLFTGGAHLVDAIPGSDWDPNIRIQGPDVRDFREREVIPELKILGDKIDDAAKQFYRAKMIRPNVVSLSLDFQHLGQRRLRGYVLVYGHQSIDEVRCFYLPGIGQV